MKAVNILTAIALSAGLISAASAAGPINANKITKRASVSYSCQSNKHLVIHYGFNAAGVPVTANVQGRTLRYDRAASDRTSVFFKDRAGYRLGAGDLNSRNHQKSSVMLTAPNNRILFKNCSAD